MTATSLHDRNCYGWVEQQCAALQERDSERLDWEGLQEDVAALGRQDYRELVSRLGVLMGHLLKWQLQPERRSRSWFLSVREQRRAITRLLEQNPSLTSHLADRLTDAVEDGFQSAVDLVLRETALGLRSLPEVSPWSLQQALDPSLLCDTRGDWMDLGL